MDTDGYWWILVVLLAFILIVPASTEYSWYVDTAYSIHYVFFSGVETKGCWCILNEQYNISINSIYTILGGPLCTFETRCCEMSFHVRVWSLSEGNLKSLIGWNVSITLQKREESNILVSLTFTNMRKGSAADPRNEDYVIFAVSSQRGGITSTHRCGGISSCCFGEQGYVRALVPPGTLWPQKYLFLTWARGELWPSKNWTSKNLPYQASHFFMRCWPGIHEKVILDRNRTQGL